MMKSTTVFLAKIWVFALLSSTFLIFTAEFSSKDFHFTINQLFIGCTFLFPFFFAFVKFGNAILINSKIDQKLNYKNELLKLAIFVSVNIWITNFFIFTLLGNLQQNHFYTFPFFLALVLGIYFFRIENVNELYDEQILDEDLKF